MRKLIITKRLVGRDRTAAYDTAWGHVLSAAARCPVRANAWRFRSAADPNAFIEFLEFSDDADPRANPSLDAALRALDTIPTAVSEEWIDAPLPSTQDTNG